MMSTAPPLVLNREQASRLQAYLQAYRHYAFASLLPSVERNTTLRILQTLQGRLISVIDRDKALLQLILTVEEMTTLKTIVTDLLLLYAKEPTSNERSATLADLAALKVTLKG